MKILTPILLLFSAAPSLAEDPSVFALAIEDAEARLEGYEKARFTFKKTIETTAGSTVLAYDPVAETPWTLVEGGQGADEILAAYNESAAEAEEPPDAGAIIDDPRKSFAEKGEPAFLREEADAYVYAMDLSEGLGISGGGRSAEIAEHLNGELFIAKDDPRFLRMRIYADAPFKPMPVAKVDSMNVNIVFAPLDGGSGPLAVHTESSEVTGSAMFKDFSETSVATYSDFQPAAAD